MPPRAYWKDNLKLSLVTCPVALFPAASNREKVSFHLLKGATGHRLKQQYVDSRSFAKPCASAASPVIGRFKDHSQEAVLDLVRSKRAGRTCRLHRCRDRAT
jgi:non-homologous end joining protein Ku